MEFLLVYNIIIIIIINIIIIIYLFTSVQNF